MLLTQTIYISWKKASGLLPYIFFNAIARTNVSLFTLNDVHTTRDGFSSVRLALGLGSEGGTEYVTTVCWQSDSLLSDLPQISAETSKTVIVFLFVPQLS